MVISGSVRGSDIMLKCRNISQSYGFIRPVNVLNNITFSLEKGKCLGIIGPNGAGKTTLLKTISGIIKKNGGEIDIAGKISYMPELSAIYNYLTARETLEFFRDVSGGTGDVLKCLEKVGLKEVENHLSYTFSKGMKRRLNLAMLLVSEPDIMLLDEPFEGLDHLSSLELTRIINSMKQEGISLIVSSHELRRLDQIADLTLILRHGSVLGQIDATNYNAFSIEFSSPLDKVERECHSLGLVANLENFPKVVVSGADSPQNLIKMLVQSGLEFASVRKISLEDIYSEEYGND